MTLPIDPVRRSAILRRSQRTGVDREDDADGVDSLLPVPVAPPTHRADPNGAYGGDGAAMFTAQVLGQDGAKRGLRAGPTAIDNAKATYNQTEWSGAKDRRARKGGVTNTDA